MYLIIFFKVGEKKRNSFQIISFFHFLTTLFLSTPRRVFKGFGVFPLAASWNLQKAYLWNTQELT